MHTEKKNLEITGMSPEEFRQAGHQLIDWIADYRQEIEHKPVRSQVKPGDVRRSFDNDAIDEVTDFKDLLESLEERVVPGVTQVQSPMHFGWFPSNASLWLPNPVSPGQRL